MTVMSRRTFLLGGVAFFPYLYVESHSLALRRYLVAIRDLPPAFAGFTILHLSDLHDKEFGNAGEELISLIRQESFDMVALTGDLVNGERPRLTPALDLVAGLQAIWGRPIFSVCGNHDWRLGRAPEFNDRLGEAGVQVLSNSSTLLERGKDRIWIVGVDDPVTSRDRLDLALRETDNRSPRLLLSHSPQIYPQAITTGMDLILSGHTHGGQIRIPMLGAAYVPKMGFFPAWDYGLFNDGATTLIVSGGLGESALPIRFNMRPELALITLQCSPEPRSGQRPAA
jgi:uncharacterized protein